MRFALVPRAEEKQARATAVAGERLTRQEANPDLLVAVGNCNAQTGLGDPYLPFREVLGLLFGDVEEKLAQNTITAENASRLQGFLVDSGEVLVEIAPDLVAALVPGSKLPTVLATASAGKSVTGRSTLSASVELSASVDRRLRRRPRSMRRSTVRSGCAFPAV